MICPRCGSDQVITTNSRPTQKMTQTWRRKKCLKCNFIFTTHEKIDLSQITVIKKDGKRVKFSRAKLYSGIYQAVAGAKKIDRGKAGVLAEKITQEIEKIILLRRVEKIESRKIYQITAEYLKPRYKGHYLRYFAYFNGD